MAQYVAQNYFEAKEVARRYYQNGGPGGSYNVNTPQGIFIFMKADFQPGGKFYQGGTQTIGAGGTGGAANGGALPANQTQPQITGGGVHWSAGAVEQGLNATQRAGEYRGIDTLVPPEMCPPEMSPDAINVEQSQKIGSRCKRQGIAKMTMDRDSVTLSSVAIGAGYRGLSLCVIPTSGELADQMVMAFADNSIGSARTSLQTALILATNQVRWGRPVTPAPGPKLTLTQVAGPKLRVTADYTNVFNDTTQKGIRNNSIMQIVLRYSTGGYPRDINGKDTGRVAGYTTVVLADYTAFTGVSTAYDSAVIATVPSQLFVSGWCVTREGITEPTMASKTIT